MKAFLLKLTISGKNFILWLRLSIFMGWMKSFLLLIAYTLYLSKWIRKENKMLKFNDFFVYKRRYHKRELLYEHVVKEQNLDNEVIDYFEFGVASGGSFKWWLTRLGCGIIGSGAIESAHRTVIQKRMKLSGQHWSREGVNNMLRLRVISMNKQWGKIINILRKHTMYMAA